MKSAISILKVLGLSFRRNGSREPDKVQLNMLVANVTPRMNKQNSKKTQMLFFKIKYFLYILLKVTIIY